jgi:hypothetical protein
VATLVVGLIDSNKNNEIKMTYKDPTLLKDVSTAKACVLTVWASFVKAGSQNTAASPSKAEPTKKDSLRVARAGTPGSTGRPVATSDSSSSLSATTSTSKSKDESPKAKKKSSKKKLQAEEGNDDEGSAAPALDVDDIDEDEEFKDKPPRRKPKPKKEIVPEDEDPIDFWNGVSKSKTTEKKKEIKKLQQSLESMSINLKSSWREDSSANQQQRFAVMINEIGHINVSPDACAGHKRVENDLQVRLAFALDITADKASGCGIDPSKWVYVELTFPGNTYLIEEPKASSKTLLIRQCPPMSTSDEIVALREPSSLGLWWTLEQRLSAFLKSEWASIEAAANKAAKSATKDAGALGSSDAWSMLEILEWPSSQLPLAIKALTEAKNDLKMALELVLEETWLEEARKEIEKNKKVKKKKKQQTEDSSASPTSDQIEDIEAPKTHTGSKFLETVIQTIKDLIQDAGKYCPICAEPHPLELFKPIVCGNELCKFQFSNMGLGVDFESELIHAPHSVDLLISMTAHAVGGNHFDPFPSEVSTKIDGLTHSFNTPADVGMCLSKCPSVDEMIELANKGKLRQHLASLHPLLYLLLRWIVTSSRAHLHFLSEDDLVPQVNTPYQFHLKSTPPEKEQKFYAAKKRYGSFYAWHGSSSANWHSILRNGLKNYSNSKHQVNGAAYGAGVYMAVDSATSIGYSWRSGASMWTKSRYEGEMILLALCEVINEGELICTGNVHRPHCLHSPSAPYYRIEKDEYIATRYMFVVTNRDIHVLAASIQSHLKTKQLLRSNKATKKKPKPQES